MSLITRFWSRGIAITAPVSVCKLSSAYGGFTRGSPTREMGGAAAVAARSLTRAVQRALPYWTHRWHVYIEQPQGRRSTFRTGCAVLCKALLTTDECLR